MDADDIRDIAEAALAEFEEAALADPATYAGGRADARDVREAVAGLRRLMEPRPAANPSHAPAHEAAAALVALAATDPDGYAGLVAPVAAAYRRGAAAPGTLDGLVTMGSFLSAVGDDHDWSADLSGPAPVVRLQGDLPAFAPTLSPRALRDLLVPLLDASAAPRP